VLDLGAKWVLYYILRFFDIYYALLMGFYPFLEDLKPIKWPNLGRKLGCDPQLKFI
jgi:hypothetical protein